MPVPLEDEDDAQAYVRAAAPVVGLTLEEDDLTRVAQQVQRAARFAHEVARAHENLDLREPAIVFDPASCYNVDADP